MERKFKVFIKRTRKGQVRKVVREHYLRDDIGTEPDGGWGDGECIVVDTNILLHQLDFLERTTSQDILQNIIILQTVLEEVKHNKLATYNRLKKMVQASGRRFFVFANEHHADTYIMALPGESPNDRNDRAIRKAAGWYQSLLGEERVVTLVTNDRDCKARAAEEGLKVETIHEFAKTRKFTKEYTDTIASQGDDEEERGTGKEATGSTLYPEHLSAEEIQDGVREGRLFIGTLHVNRDNATEGNVVLAEGHRGDQVGEHKMDGAQSLLVSGRTHLNRAMDMDRVVVQILPKDQWRGPTMTIVAELEEEEGADSPADAKQPAADADADAALRPAGRVVGIERRAWRPYCGSIEPPMNPRDKMVLFAPVSKSIPKVRIQTKQVEDLLNKRIVVAIDAWHATSKYPTGHYVRTIGKVGDIDCESEVILLEHEVCIREFAPNAFKELPKVGPNGEWDPSPEDLKGRVDLREGYRVCSIDPPGCKDIDDALHVKPLGGGRTEVGVHIADVTHFVAPNSTLDDEARFRGTSVYLVQKRIDMLPSLLTTDLCSLRGKVDRLAFSVVWTLDDDAQILDVRFHRSVIRSVAAMTYGQAQSMIDDESDNSDLAQDLRTMREVTRKLRARRVAAGALSLASPEVRFELDSETHDPIDVRMYELKETNAMVEEMMLLANCTVAKHIQQNFPNCSMLRRHPSPPQSNFEPLRKVAEALGFKLESQSNQALAASLDKMNVDGNAMANKLLRILATRAMSQAVYFASGDVSSSADFLHYGLAAPIYTHFTSPIRRYADVVVHRLLAASIGLSGVPDDLNTTAGVKEVANGINHRHRMAQFAGRASTELHAHVFFKDKVVVEDAYVMRLRKNGIIVLITRYGLEVPVFLSRKGEPAQYKLSGDGMALSSDLHHIRVLDKLQVRLSVEKDWIHRTNLKVELVHPATVTAAGEGGEPASGSVRSSEHTAASKRSARDDAVGGTPKKKPKKGK